MAGPKRPYVPPKTAEDHRREGSKLPHYSAGAEDYVRRRHEKVTEQGTMADVAETGRMVEQVRDRRAYEGHYGHKTKEALRRRGPGYAFMRGLGLLGDD